MSAPPALPDPTSHLSARWSCLLSGFPSSSLSYPDGWALLAVLFTPLPTLPPPFFPSLLSVRIASLPDTSYLWVHGSSSPEPLDRWECRKVGCSMGWYPSGAPFLCTYAMKKRRPLLLVRAGDDAEA
jgi:hypothetical protein